MTEASKPPKIAETAAATGEKKASLDIPVLAMLGILAGIYIAFGSLLTTMALAGTEDALPFGVRRLLAGLVFSLGLVLVIVSGAELFTGNTLLVVAWAEGRSGLGAIASAWALAWIFNLAGSLLAVFAAWGAGLFELGEDAFRMAAIETAQHKGSLDWGTIFVSGILANMLVCLAVWMCWGAKSAADKVLVIIPPITAFVALNTEHSVANMSLIPLGWLARESADAAFWAQQGAAHAQFPGASVAGLVSNLIPSTLGNIVGGGIIGAAYWFAYLRPGKDGG